MNFFNVKYMLKYDHDLEFLEFSCAVVERLDDIEFHYSDIYVSMSNGEEDEITEEQMFNIIQDEYDQFEEVVLNKYKETFTW